MKIRQISFRMNVEVAPFRHEHVEVTVELGKGDTPEKAKKFAQATARKLLGADVTYSLKSGRCMYCD